MPLSNHGHGGGDGLIHIFCVLYIVHVCNTLVFYEMGEAGGANYLDLYIKELKLVIFSIYRCNTIGFFILCLQILPYIFCIVFVDE